MPPSQHHAPSGRLSTCPSGHRHIPSLLEELQARLPSRQRQPVALAPAAAYATASASAPFRCIVATTLSTPPSLPRRAASGPAPSRRDSASQDSPSQHGGALRATPPPEGLFEPHLPQTWPSASPPAHLGRRCEHRVVAQRRREGTLRVRTLRVNTEGLFEPHLLRRGSLSRTSSKCGLRPVHLPTSGGVASTACSRGCAARILLEGAYLQAPFEPT